MKKTKRQRRAKVPARPQVHPRKKSKISWRTFKKYFNSWRLFLIDWTDPDGQVGRKALYRHEHRLMYEE